MTALYAHLLEPQHASLLEAAAACEDFTRPAVLERLRGLAPPDAPPALFHAAIELVRARRKGAAKFSHPERLLLDPLGLEQASSTDVADHKAARFAQLGAAHVLDLCCGIGGDAMSLAQHADLTLVDIDPGRLAMAQHNVRTVLSGDGHDRAVNARADDVTTLDLPNLPFHIDPDRRATGRRTHSFDDIVPPPGFIRRLIERNAHGCVKLSPGVDSESLPPGEIEFINRQGTLVQALLWTGDLADPDSPRTATRLEADGRVHRFTGTPDAPIPIAQPKRFLLLIDPGIERAQLLGQLATHLNAPCVHPSLGLLTADEAPDSPFVTSFELIETLPWRMKKVKGALRDLDAGLIEVKTRGKATDPNAAAAQLRGQGPNPFTVFVLRAGKKITAYITKRL